MSSHLESVGENEVGLPPLLQKDAGDSIFSSRDGPSSTSALQVCDKQVAISSVRDHVLLNLGLFDVLFLTKVQYFILTTLRQ